MAKAQAAPGGRPPRGYRSLNVLFTTDELDTIRMASSLAMTASASHFIARVTARVARQLLDNAKGASNADLISLNEIVGVRS